MAGAAKETMMYKYNSITWINNIQAIHSEHVDEE
jgi:hypothetical protein